jgi:hypothetical protein
MTVIAIDRSLSASLSMTAAISLLSNRAQRKEAIEQAHGVCLGRRCVAHLG